MSVAEKFEAIGTRIEERPLGRRQFFRPGTVPLSINIAKDKKGEYFTIAKGGDVLLETLQVDPKDRHLLLLARANGDKLRYLCGHDERHYFVAQVPEAVSTIADARAALRPNELRDVKLPRKQRNKRKTSEFLRQGEWFFVPIDFEPEGIRTTNEPLQRSAGNKPHIVEEVCRNGGETVYIGSSFRDGFTGPRTTVELSVREYNDLDEEERRKASWRMMTRGATVYARGKVSHSDHATIELRGWHRVFVNGEGLTRSETVAFLD